MILFLTPLGVCFISLWTISPYRYRDKSLDDLLWGDLG
jgi:hypothetical protein